MSAQIFIVEDDARLSEMMAEYLEKLGYSTTVERNGAAAVERILAVMPDLVVLDVMLPGEDGLSICRRLRPSFGGPILMLTARDDEIDEVLGLELGADDYVTKPASLRKVAARIKALLRRGVASGAEQQIVVGEIEIDRRTRELRCGGVFVETTTAEFDLLWLLMRSAGRVCTRQELMQELRGIDYDGLDRSMDVRVSKLRIKLGDDPQHPTRIKTVRGVGYLFASSVG